jgi:hypothetical protein
VIEPAGEEILRRRLVVRPVPCAKVPGRSVAAATGRRLPVSATSTVLEPERLPREVPVLFIAPSMRHTLLASIL